YCWNAAASQSSTTPWRSASRRPHAQDRPETRPRQVHVGLLGPAGLLLEMRGGRRHSLRTLRCRSLDAQASCEPGSLGRRPSTGSPSPPACLYNFLYHRSTPPNTALAGPPRPPVARTATLMSHGDNLDDLRRHPIDEAE